MKKFVLLAAVICFVSVVSVAQNGFAAIYKYTDKDGMIYFADDLQSVPAQYRSTAKIISGEVKEKPAETQQQPALPPETAKNEAVTPPVQEKPLHETIAPSGSFGSRALVSTIVVISALFGFFILKIVDADHKKAVVITRVIIVWGVTVFLLYAHGRDVVAAIGSAANKLENSQKEAEEKGKKAAKAVKSLDALIEKVENMSSTAGDAGPEKKEEK
jgi:hypothetical protein